MKKAVVFDFDGVIIDSIEIQKQALMESYKIVVGDGEPSFEEFLSNSGNSLENIFLNMKLPIDMIEPYGRISCERINSIKVYEGMKELLIQLTSDGYSCALCTGKYRDRTTEILDKLKLKEYFEVIICSDDVENPKPYPDSLTKAINNMDCNFNDAVMIGDAKNDILCAKHSGVKSIAVTWGNLTKEVLKGYSPDCIVDTVGELYIAIKNILDT